jgi:hypothetical protein
MFYYVFLDPSTIDEASQAGEMGLGRLIELLRGFRRDVILVETDNWRVGNEIAERVRAIPFQYERRLIENLLIALRQSSPLVLLEGDDDGAVSLADFAKRKASEAGLDLILGSGEQEAPEGVKWIKISLTRCHDSEFSRKRERLANGLNLKEGSKCFNEVAETCFSKLVRFAEWVRVYDYALGKYYSYDQRVNLKRLVRFLRDHAKNLNSLEIHTLSKERIGLERDVRELQNEVNFKIELKFRERDSELPHPRYLGAHNRYLDIDRGIDLCDAHDKCRLTQIKYAAAPE